ncbi:MAG TPA: hypothetical protein H9829_10465 [Candidatus Tetragenococcus pullicola]|nr:hypothetical protein [Candidatus Tetragenococcus pullicola]
MNLFDALEWSQWKKLSNEVKSQVISQVLMYFVSPLKKVSNVEYKQFQIAGIKCTSFECLIDNEPFVLVPGNKETILGWDLGTQGLPVTVWDQKTKSEDKKFLEIKRNYQLETTKDWDIFVNESTSPLRKVSIPPMLIQKKATPVGTEFIGVLDAITGIFKGDNEKYAKVQEELNACFQQVNSLEESLIKPVPRELYKKNLFYAWLDTNTEKYHVYSHQECTQKSLKEKLDAEVFDLLSEDQWEYAVAAGTRKLFRWGNDIDRNQPYYGKQVIKKIEQSNMFGLYFDFSFSHWEITNSNRLKLEKQAEVGIPLYDCLPLSSYYRSQKILSENEYLDADSFLYRKAIIIQNE